MPTTPVSADIVSWIMAFEQGELDDESIIVLFQELVDTGQAWHLQGSYGRMAQALIDAGYVELDERFGGSNTYDPHSTPEDS